jgi:type IV secretion system protein VirB1
MMLPGMELLSCPEMAVPREVMQHVVHVESSHNPYAIGVVGGHLVRQPKNLDEALATVRMLESRGFNFSVGIAQVNRYNLARYGLASYAQAFEVCPNLQAGARILAECYQRHKDWGKSFSCYYSGNPVTGYRHGYVQKVFASIRQAQGGSAQAEAGGIAVVEKASRRAVPVERFPLRNDGRGEQGISRTSPIVPAGPSNAPADPAMVQSVGRVATAAPEPQPVAQPTPATVAPSFAQQPSMQAPAWPSGPVRLQPTTSPAPTPVNRSAGGDEAFVF